MNKRIYHIVNGITLYRLMAVPLLILLVFYKRLDLFKWLLAFSFFTDVIDGYLARRYNVISIIGAKLDSIADDLTIVAAMIGVFIFRMDFLKQHFLVIILLFAIYLLQLILALARYGKMSGFHTVSAKISTVLQGTFFLLLFFLPIHSDALFFITIFFTAINLIEEIILVLLLPQWQADVKGLYWVIKKRQSFRS